MQDILRQIDIDVRCDECEGSYIVPASLVAVSHELLDEGCSGTSPYECAPSFYASLVDRAALEALVRAWRDVASSAAAHAKGIDVRARPKVELVRRDVAALARWEDDGGVAEADAA
jgi:hypothetical protein